jgi:hypothetical protein
VCIFICKNLRFRKINTLYNCKEKDLEMCAIELETKASKLIILCLYITPTGDFNQFIKNLDISLKHLFQPKTVCNLWGYKYGFSR